MKKTFAVLLIIALSIALLTGCFGRRKKEPTVPTTTAPTVAPTTRPVTVPTTAPTMPSMDDIIPGTEDTVDPDSGAHGETIDPNNGANREKDNRKNSPKF